MQQNVNADYFLKLNLSINSINTESNWENNDTSINYHKYGNIVLCLIIIGLGVVVFIIIKFKYFKGIQTNHNSNIQLNESQTNEFYDKSMNASKAVLKKITESKVLLTLK